MLRTLATATDDVFAPRVRRYLGAALLLGVGVFVAAWFAVDAAIGWWAGDQGALPTILSWLGGLAALVLAWFLFPTVVSSCVCLFLDGIANTIERRHWPELPPAPGLPWTTALAVSLRFLVLLLTVNVLLLGLMLVPPVYAVAWLVANGWLLGIEYFELVALRRLDPTAARALRRRHRVELLVLGATFALLFTVPVLNLVMPAWATAVMVHRCRAWLDAA